MIKTLGVIAVMVMGALVNAYSQESAIAKQYQGPTGLEAGFKDPPATSRPQTWWHWMNGNVTQEGIIADLEAMKGIGIGGVQIFEVDASIPQGPVGLYDSVHMKMYKTAFETADRLGMEMVLHNAPGWSSSGGPWVEPEDAMKQLVWSETVVSCHDGKQNIFLRQPYTKLGYYRDSYVLAFPTFPGEEKPAGKLAEISANTFEMDPPKVADEDWTSIHWVRKSDDGTKGYVEFSFKEPYTARSLTVVPAVHRMGFSGSLQVSDDGKSFTEIAPFVISPWFNLEGFACISFEPACGKYFRVVFNAETIVREIELSAGPRVHQLETKASYVNYALQPPPVADYTREISSAFTIDPKQIIDLSGLMEREGSLKWEVPKGTWTIMRFGYTLTAQENIVPSKVGRGLEIDKFSARALDNHFDAVFGNIKKHLGPVLGTQLHRTFIDSYEVSMQNWTGLLPDEFKSRYGYDLLKFMPVLAGRYVKDVITSEKFLWDFRRNLAEMYAGNYVGQLHRRCREEGMLLSIEPYPMGPFDDFQAGGRADIPMGEFWSRLTFAETKYVKLPGMIAHTYGKRVNGHQVVEAESFTGAAELTSWKNYPYSLKAQGDFAFCLGVNRHVLVCHAHQPHPAAAPGMTLGKWGSHFNRNNTWFDKAGPWISYLSRCQYLLQQGNIVADLCYFAGENSPVRCLQPHQLVPAPPRGYDYDIANTEVLLNRMRVKDGRIVLPDGVSYRLLIFPGEIGVLSTGVVKQIGKLVSQGAHVICAKPSISPSLADYSTITPGEYKALVGDIWGEVDGKEVKENRYGLGTIYWGKSVEEVIEILDGRADFLYTSRNPDTEINYIHRKTEEADFYFVANRKRRNEQIIAEFRIEGKQPELWDPESGTMQAAPLFDQDNGIVRVPITLDESGSVFVVFRKPAGQSPVEKLESIQKTQQADLAGIRDNFTISAWIKPETNIRKPHEAIMGMTGDFALGCVVYPPDGDMLYGPDHRAAGFAAGINGICVMEKDSRSYPAVLVWDEPVEGWTHVAIVYRNGTPRLYVDGKFVKEGIKSGYTVHPGTGYPHRRIDVPYFEGDATEPELNDRALTEDEIRVLFAKGLPLPAMPLPLRLIKNDEILQAEVFENGTHYPLGSSKTPINVNDLPAPVVLDGAWKVSFVSPARTPGDMVMEKLGSWIESDNQELRYFSGTGTYTQAFNLKKELFRKDQRLYLDLGRVEVIASIKVNDKDLGILWKPPYRIDITDVARPGKNTIEISVTNLWPNRLIGDAGKPTENVYGKFGNIVELPAWYREGKKMPAGERSTFATWDHYTGKEALLESGLLGPVRIFQSRIIKL